MKTGKCIGNPTFFKKSFLGTALILAVTLGCVAGDFVNGVRVDGAAPGEWTHDWDAASAAAKKDGKPIFINFTGSDWCGWCKLLKRQVFTQPEWGEWASNNVYLVHVDFPNDKELVPEKYRERNRELSRRYKVNGYPTCYLLDSANLEPLGRFGASRDVTASKFIEKVSAAMPAKNPNTKEPGAAPSAAPQPKSPIVTGGDAGMQRLSTAKTGNGSDSEEASGFEISNGVLQRLKRRDAEEIDVPSSVKALRYGSFLGATRLRVVRLPEGLETIGERSFEFLRQLETVTLPASVTKIGPGAFLGCNRLTNLDIAPGSKFEVRDGLLLDKSAKTVLFAFPKITRVVIPEFITEISQMAFIRCEELKEVVLPEGLLKIGQSAFRGCRNLEALRLPASLETMEGGAFAECSALGRIEVAPGGRYAAFANCLIGDGGKTLIRGFGDMEELRIPDGVERVAPEAFSGSRFLRKAYVPDSCTNIGYGVFSKCLKLEELRLPAKVEQCGSNIADGCLKLRELVMPEGLTSLSFTYRGCRSLKELKIPGSVKSVGQQTIQDCDGLTEIVFPEGVKTFDGNWIVSSCSNLLRIELPSTVAKIQGTAVFAGNPKLETIDVSPSNRFFQSIDGVLFDKDMKRLVQCPGAKSGIYDIPSSVEEINAGAFARCMSLTEIRIPASVREIGYLAFDCPAKTNWFVAAGTNLSQATKTPEEKQMDEEEITVPGTARKIQYGSFNSSGKSKIKVIRLSEGVERIGERSFNNLTHLEKIVIPSTVTQIDSGAFRWVHGLKEIEIAPGAPFKLENGLLLDKMGKKLVFAMPWLERVTIPDSVISVDDLAFVACQKLQSIVVSGNHPTLSTDEHCLFGDSGKTLIKAFGSPVEITIPNEVQRIAPEAFSHCDTLRSAFVPDSVSDIGIWAFSRCFKLQTLRLPVKVDKCSPRIAESCTSLQRLVLPEGVEELVFSYSGLRSVTQLDFPKSVKTIGQQAIERCEGLTEIIFPEGISEFRGGWAVSHCPNLVLIRLPSTLEKVEGFGVFGDNPQLEAIEISPSNRFFKSVDGVLFDKDMTRLIQCPGAKSGIYEIPGTVTQINPFAFSGCRNLTEIKIPASLKTIGDKAFYDCPAKRSHVVP